ncbi:flavin monoamine oxidase family protein [Puia dinghuensis]|uniref:Tryptophan 2-monooxygenase n=1 Tax=Puia dinghuensis TaxID=1792502 RepID=A0A8J2UCA9_9BACT|nr:NAD(P)/FAD-dependent oxidoreductase [Puia dinghuensis]GGA95077.1 hypothetical protein GCM10011511_18010 [Puia dinghuensis]
MSIIIIIGAGAAGLQAGRHLSKAGNRVTVLEAASEPGGRILPLAPRGFSKAVEGGAEFIHGPLPLSLELAKEAGVELQPVRAQLMRKPGATGSNGAGDPDAAADGDWEGMLGDDWDELMQQMEAMTEDMPFEDFLSLHFAGERYAGLRQSVRRFAEGYDLADLHRVSTQSLYREWVREGEEEEYRPVGGYRRMIDFLVEECRRAGAEVICSSPVAEVHWQKGSVEVLTAGGASFTADKLVVTVSLGVLAAGDLRFHPVLPVVDEAVRRLGYGSVVKIFLEFKNPFWLEKKAEGETIFVISDQEIPVWWTQTEADSRVLTGWLAGENMRRFQHLDEKGRLASCLRSLAAIFYVEVGFLQRELAASLVLDWAEAPFVRGGYSFDTVGAADAKATLSRPVEDTIFFAGEVLYEGDAPGTVEAAFWSGRDVAEKIMARR